MTNALILAAHLNFGPDNGSVSLVYTSFGDTNQFTEACVPHYERAFEDAKKQGISVKALVLCNPHNPLGKSQMRLDDGKVAKPPDQT